MFNRDGSSGGSKRIGPALLLRMAVFHDPGIERHTESKPMAYRLLLVSLVAILGLDLPTDRNVDEWCQSGLGWFQARIDELKAATTEEPDPAVAAQDGGEAPATEPAP